MDKTDIARIYRDCYGATRFGETDYLFAKAIERFVSTKSEAENAALKAELESLRKDADRYRWLRDPSIDVGLVLDKIVGTEPANEFGGGAYRIYEYRAGTELDQAIDAAIAAAPKEKYPQQPANYGFLSCPETCPAISFRHNSCQASIACNPCCQQIRIGG